MLKTTSLSIEHSLTEDYVRDFLTGWEYKEAKQITASAKIWLGGGVNKKREIHHETAK